MRTREWWPPGLGLAVVNGEGWRTAQIPAVNGHGSARTTAVETPLRAITAPSR